MTTQLNQLAECGQSIWIDYIRRNMFSSGELQKLIDLGLRGMTSNPTIFEKAISGGTDYDEQLQRIAGTSDDPNIIFEALAIEDIRNALDAFRPLFDASQRSDGFVSLEVSPLLSDDTAGTVAAAKRLWAAVDRPNLMIKIPATPAGIPAITQTIAAGINVNVTLIFSIESYEAAANAYIAGLEQALSNGKIDHIASVASIFISRIDTAVDKLLQEKIAQGKPLQALLGKAGIANVQLAYDRFRTIFGSERFLALRKRGAREQRPLWASTGTKNPAYSDLLYIENLVAPNTVNTVPPATLQALLDHGVVRPNAIEAGLSQAHPTMQAIEDAGISLSEVMQKLQLDGVALFADSYRTLLSAIEEKRRTLLNKRPRNRKINLDSVNPAFEQALADLTRRNFLAKLWKNDPSAWSSDPQHEEIIRHSLGWLTFPERVRERIDDVLAFAREIAARFTHVVVLGMGGSSLAPDVLRATFGKVEGFPTLHVLDSSDPVQIQSLERTIDLARTLFIVASKSGTTTEPEAFFRYFHERVTELVGAGKAGEQFIAITDPDTKLVNDAKTAGFRRAFLNDPTIGGRYSALSYFGIVPAALAGYDVRAILDRGLDILHAHGAGASVGTADGVRLGAAFAVLTKSGRDKLTIVAHPAVSAFGAWAEQLIAESTGKMGVGIVPIEGEALGIPDEYGSDRVFVYVGADLPRHEHILGKMDDRTIETRLEMLATAGHPIIRLPMNDARDIGAQFALWELATATAGALLNIDPFDQPNVQESKDNTKRLLTNFAKNGILEEPPVVVPGEIADVIAFSGSRDLHLGDSLESAVSALFTQVHASDYLALTAYLAMNESAIEAIDVIRVKIRNALRVATTVGFGPRFLHSTGQLHKGGPATGVFLQLTSDPPLDLKIPGMVSFRTLEHAQSLGDFESLDKRARRGLRLHLKGDILSALTTLADIVDNALAALLSQPTSFR
ncbi:MAG TPA: bifunctional transaldolase/phosoglucose isomerase [Candidatus Baltobacteraceae bacterium]|jgi:transaldolase/glucose-6-phosphate isomerase|nr:bifunctional transaldolase/phosoglucose isomerase [Candidatus Baltobacteraceae bacterium]